jgi:hypothetical protein
MCHSSCQQETCVSLYVSVHICQESAAQDGEQEKNVRNVNFNLNCSYHAKKTLFKTCVLTG